ncbi:MAG: nuclear transport factor 2 family protein [Armatimonadetes bacterium]|nr:nuclear transport factor 2 family protein [Armatimonadota bacterium]
MLKRTPALLLAALLALSPLAARAAESPTAAFRKDLNAKHARYAQLLKAKNFEGLHRYMRGITTPDFRLVTANGNTHTLDEWIASSKAAFAPARRVDRAQLITQTALVKGNTATARTYGNFRFVLVDEHGKPHHMDVRGVYQETHVKTPSGWKLKRVKDLWETIRMDGKPVPASPVKAKTAPGKRPSAHRPSRGTHTDKGHGKAHSRH